MIRQSVLHKCRDHDSKVYSLQLPFKPEPEKIAAQQAAAGAGALPPGIPPPPNFGGGLPPLPPQGPAPPPQFNPVRPRSSCAVFLNLLSRSCLCQATNVSNVGHHALLLFVYTSCSGKCMADHEQTVKCLGSMLSTHSVLCPSCRPLLAVLSSARRHSTCLTR